LLLETAVMPKMLTVVLLTEKHLAVSFWTFSKYLSNQGALEKKKLPEFLLMQGYLSKLKLSNSLFCFKIKVSTLSKEEQNLKYTAISSQKL